LGGDTNNSDAKTDNDRKIEQMVATRNEKDDAMKQRKGGDSAAQQLLHELRQLDLLTVAALTVTVVTEGFPDEHSPTAETSESPTALPGAAVAEARPAVVPPLVLMDGSNPGSREQDFDSSPPTVGDSGSQVLRAIHEMAHSPRDYSPRRSTGFLDAAVESYTPRSNPPAAETFSDASAPRTPRGEGFAAMLLGLSTPSKSPRSPRRRGGEQDSVGLGVASVGFASTLVDPRTAQATALSSSGLDDVRWDNALNAVDIDKRAGIFLALLAQDPVSAAQGIVSSRLDDGTKVSCLRPMIVPGLPNARAKREMLQRASN